VNERAALGRSGEAVLVAAAGGVLGWCAGALVHPVVGDVLALIAAANGAICGWRGIYPWRRWHGWLAFVLDSTWAAVPVAVGLLAHLVAAFRHGGFVAGMSARRGYHVYRGGMSLKPGFAFTIGNVISGAGEVSRAGRAKLVTDHEAVHVWQARWFGPLYLVLYGLWAAVGAVVGLATWLRRGRKEPAGPLVEACSYYMNPFEWWAYSRDGYWPPNGLRKGIGWKGPVVRSFVELRAPATEADD
jgi:hypothetical protein